ncbi:MAG: radical SAM protein, partial [Phycisphaerae bacterium]|nr:radical SAM protein [Phycisphaerae bacterium]
MSDYHDAMLWEADEAECVKCNLCGQACRIPPGQYGACRVRLNVGGQLKSTNYEAVVAMHVDPIEKKPLFHFLPGTLSLSIAAAGCNFQCSFCQNWQISQAPRNDSCLT